MRHPDEVTADLCDKINHVIAYHESLRTKEQTGRQEQDRLKYEQDQKQEEQLKIKQEEEEQIETE